MADELQGTITRIVRERGFGFIRSGDGEYFFHRSDYDGNFDTLAEKTHVTFTETQSSKGPRAGNVSRKVIA